MRPAPVPEDDLGHPIRRDGRAQRAVSLVPSLTEALASVDPGAVVGATDWCTHPADLQIARVRGTKNPDIRAIVALAPDLVIANQEENREIDVRRLRDAGIPVWVTRIETLEQAFSSLERLFEVALLWGTPPWLDEARAVWSTPPAQPSVRVVVPIWRDPWMVVGPRTFTADLLRRAGAAVGPDDAGDRYPSVEIHALDALGADVVLLPDEPYVFTAADGPEAFVRTPTRLANGRLLTWYGPSLIDARAHIERLLSPA